MQPSAQELELAAGVAAAVGAVACGVYGTMWPASQWFGRTLIAGADPLEIALTFDDGPNGDTTARLLDMLAAAQIKATFFLVGRYVLAQPALAQRIAAEGHAIGNHTMTHPRLLILGPAATRREISDAGKAIADTIGVEANLFRPPFGGRWPHTLRAARELGLTTVMWNALGMDWKLTDPAEISARLTGGMQRNRRNGVASNLLMHDGSHRGQGWNREATLGAVGLLLAARRPEDRFVTVESWIRVA